MEHYDAKNIYYPPGGILIWMLIFLELITFSVALIVFAFMRHGDLELFNSSQELLNKALGTINTGVLITSGFFMAMTVHNLKIGDNKKSQMWLGLTMFFGLLFLIFKGYEFSAKISHGIFIGHNQFFTFYWLLTGFHFIHVFVGMIILIFLFFKIKSGYYSKDNFFDVETGGAFWHMCDLIWLFLFPVLYLLH